jgi:hypothetical protein
LLGQCKRDKKKLPHKKLSPVQKIHFRHNVFSRSKFLSEKNELLIVIRPEPAYLIDSFEDDGVENNL